MFESCSEMLYMWLELVLALRKRRFVFYNPPAISLNNSSLPTLAHSDAAF